MIKTCSKSILLTVLLTPLLFADAAKSKQAIPKQPAFQTVWQKIYGEKEDDIANGVVMLEEGDVAVVGECKSFNAERSDICVTRVNKKGDTLWKIARDHKTTVDKLMALNNLKSKKLYPGMKLYVP